MKKKTIILVILLLLVILAAIFAVLRHQKEPLSAFIEDQTNYTVYDCVNENGEIDVVIGFQTDADPELYAQYCARMVLCAIKQFPQQAEDTPKEVTIRVYSKSSKHIVLRISVKGEDFLETLWETLLEEQLPNNVDYYYFNEKDF